MITQNLYNGQVISMPVAHADGRYFIEEDGLLELIQNDQILFQYCDDEGRVSDEANINGSVYNIAGICNLQRNVFGMMPHPERAAESILGNQDGKLLFDSLVCSVKTVPA